MYCHSKSIWLWFLPELNKAKYQERTNMNSSDELWNELPLRVARRDAAIFLPGSVVVGYIYTNWQGKHFLIDDEFTRQFQASLAVGDEASEDSKNKALPIKPLTPESLLRDLPTHEEEQRMDQLEEMWERSTVPTEQRG
jgi:hypothetical protein